MRTRPVATPLLRLLAIAVLLLCACRTHEDRTVVGVSSAPQPGATTTPAVLPPSIPHDDVAVAKPVVQAHLVYPDARRGSDVDDWHGTKVEDPYRWLEDSDSPETRVWIDAENSVTQAYLSRIAKRDTIRDRLTELWDFERYQLPYREGGRYVITKNDGLVWIKRKRYFDPALNPRYVARLGRLNP